LRRGRERKSKRKRRGFVERNLKNQEEIEILGAKLKLLLGLLLIEVRGLDFIHNPLYNLFFFLNSKVLICEK